MLKLEIRTDNAAFADGLQAELGALLSGVIEEIYAGVTQSQIHDSNGNTVGAWELTSERS